ncbi:NAD(P)/FAD-dependent oxidoreductase [Mycobacterium sp. M1]|uniref:NAD(P)/FAD-dependent oxidoreductase n=1 Tax=Mycolicibacter acidiphilus TaxID=2835306 RepID=A0ABS5RF32_9MYCO|nr:NAD(P)/FAD-dependent oxidoreductase [Mycolicibacter acidiphilus]MBS9532897.1 NAD(P)/FAD-dependent oxidoreductase [Mycolicibacter acidiphilus]
MTGTDTDPRVHATVIVGAGLSGIGAAIRLRQAGVDDIVIVERADTVGGTWRDTEYPGAACDIPALLYCFSFAAPSDWSHLYARAAGVRAYIEQLVDDHRLRPLIRFGLQVTGLHFDEETGTWLVDTARGVRLRARSVVLARGPLSDPSYPDLDDRGDYRGHTVHSARWDRDYDFTGKRVAVIGTGASAVQIVPELAEIAASVTVFQRTPTWVLPRLDAALPRVARALFTRSGAARRIARSLLYWYHEFNALALVWNSPLTRLVSWFARAHLRRQVKDPALRRRLTPDFTVGCKRMLISSDYYRALGRHNCRLIDTPISRMTHTGIRTADHVDHGFDAVVFATGYQAQHIGPPFPVTGTGGRRLADDWARGGHAHKGINTHGYPNLFFLTGPNSGPAHHSVLVYVEAQIDYAVAAIGAILTADLHCLDVRADAEDRHNRDIRRRLAATTWMTGCRSWFLTADGANPTLYPGFATQYRRQMREFRLADYHVVSHYTAAQALAGRVRPGAGATYGSR